MSKMKNPIKPKDTKFGHTFSFVDISNGKKVYGYAATDITKIWTRWSDCEFFQEASDQYALAAKWLRYKNKRARGDS